MKEFSMKESKKSMLMLVALFMLGACSTNNSNSDSPQPHETWADEVSNMYVYFSQGGFGADELCYVFTADAAVMYEMCELDNTTNTTRPYKIHSGSTETSATYSASYGGSIETVKFTNLNDKKGDIERDTIFGDYVGTFTLSKTLTSTSD